MSLDPTPSSKDRHEGPSIRTGPTPAVRQHAPAENGEQPIRTLLWTAATYRPLEEVVALVNLLNRTGEVPNPGDETLRAAAVARPLEEVRQLVALLNEPPHDVGEADTTLRAAAVGRPIEDVAELVTILGTEDSKAGSHTAVEEQQNAGGTTGPASEDALPSSARAATKPGTSRIVARFGGRSAAGSGDRTGSPALRSVLRWPAAAALIVCSVLHLPRDFTILRSAGYADDLSLAISGLCLVIGVWLAVQDTMRIWAAGAAAAVGVAAVYALSGFGTVALLGNSLGETLPWANVVAVSCAAITAGLAGSVVIRRQKAAIGATSDT